MLKTQERRLEVMYFTGDSGTGKTTLAKQIAKNRNYSYYVSSASNDILDSYAGQDCLILDDLRPSCLSLADLLKLLDNHTSSTVKSRYYNKILECKLIVVTITIPLTALNYDTLQEWALKTVREKELTKKQYYNLTVIIRQSLDYAVQKGILEENPFSKVHVESKLFKVKKKAEDRTQVFLTDEQTLIESEAYRDFEETGYSACLAIPFVFQTGLRLGEVVALKESDIQGSYIHVQRMEVRTVEQRADGSWSTQKFKVVDYTKSEAGDRFVYLSSKAKDVIKRVMENNTEHGFNDEGYLFQNEDGRVHSKGVDCRIRKYCRHIGISEKAMHKIRKTYISALIDSGLNINEIRKLAGHEDERTTYGNYCFNRLSNTQTESILEKALCS